MKNLPHGQRIAPAFSAYRPSVAKTWCIRTMQGGYLLYAREGVYAGNAGAISSPGNICIYAVLCMDALMP